MSNEDLTENQKQQVMQLITEVMKDSTFAQVVRQLVASDLANTQDETRVKLDNDFNAYATKTSIKLQKTVDTLSATITSDMLRLQDSIEKDLKITLADQAQKHKESLDKQANQHKESLDKQSAFLTSGILVVVLTVFGFINTNLQWGLEKSLQQHDAKNTLPKEFVVSFEKPINSSKTSTQTPQKEAYTCKLLEGGRLSCI
jgi:hypothetical protein